MALIRHPDSGLFIADPGVVPLKGGDPALTKELLDTALKKMILSASGWRGIFAKNGGEESPEEEISPVHGVMAAVAAGIFAEYLKKKSGLDRPQVIVGMDSRPTGPAIADPLVRAFLAQGCGVRFAFIIAAPEIMAYARTGSAQGFVYISASHNPIGFNGLKFGLTDGGVLPAGEAQLLIEEFRARMADPEVIPQAVSWVSAGDIQELTGIYSGASRIKAEAYGAYLGFIRELTAGEHQEQAETGGDLLEAITRSLKKEALAVAADFNGSARTLSIDREFLSSLGLGFYGMSEKPREIAHRIVPEGESLEPCRLFVEKLHREDPSVVIGYVPDCDGDRGNLVFWDAVQGRARALEAQEVFALACVSELAHLVWTGELRFDSRGNALRKAAVAVNGPTSLRIDRIADAFDVSVFRAEVGEANVVGLARKLREQGYLVRILGEGSAGGNITHPSAVRDPINTVLALIKLLTVRSEGDRKGFFELWCALSDQAEMYHPDFTLADIIAALPPFITTGSYTEEAVLRIKTADHGLLKNRYQEIFLREWEERKDYFNTRYGITAWSATAFVGMEEKRGLSRFGDAGRGGLKIIFSTKTGHTPACIWMRGSGTEPVFRVMADVEGSDKRMERDLIEWQRHLVTLADQAGD
ncbi:MAG: phosphatidylglycerol lysyltransferase [Spirochaetaceae bacterium]|jgi:phosphoglucomutase|nr:phosphatidylglycerol lysyltransferase [Spirochaetaceae bacterium]